MLSQPPEWTTAIESCLGKPSKARVRLQYVQNLTATELCWHLLHLRRFPVKFRINYKTLLLTYKSTHALAPQYLRPPSPIHHVPEPSRKFLFTESSWIMMFSLKRCQQPCCLSSPSMIINVCVCLSKYWQHAVYKCSQTQIVSLHRTFYVVNKDFFFFFFIIPFHIC